MILHLTYVKVCNIGNRPVPKFNMLLVIQNAKLLFSSPELKDQASLIACCSLSVRLSVHTSVNFSHFNLLKNHWTHFN